GAVRAWLAGSAGRLAARPRHSRLGTGPAGRGAGQGAGAGRAILADPARVRRPAGWDCLWLAGWVRFLDDREFALFSALQRRTKRTLLGPQRLFWAESRPLLQYGRPRTWRGTLSSFAGGSCAGVRGRADAGDLVPRLTQLCGALPIRRIVLLLADPI